MARRLKGRSARGTGSVYEEDPKNRANRTTQWVGEKWVTLPDGRRKRVKVRGTTQTETVAKLERRVREVVLENPDATRQGAVEFLEEWLKHKAAHVRASTLRAYEQDVAHLRDPLRGLRLARVQSRHIQAAVDRLASDGHPSMADRVRRTAKQAFRQAIKWGLLNANPVDQLDPVRRPEPKRGVMTAAEMGKLLSAAEGTVYYWVFVVALSTGMRKGEVLALKWGDVAPDGVTVRRTLSHRAAGDGTGPPKTRAGVRFVPVPPHTMAGLLATRSELDGPDDWVFTTRSGKRFSPRNVSHALHVAQRRAGVPEIRFHDLRRTYATQLAAGGAHPRVIQALLGHSTPTLAMTIYTEATESARRAAVVDVLGGGSSGRRATAREGTRADSPRHSRSSRRTIA